jgi:hypothetical protein
MRFLKHCVLLLSVALAGAGCCKPLFGAKLSGDECRPRALSKMDSCEGEDESWQECRFYFRATGVPETQWCESLAKTARKDPLWDQSNAARDCVNDEECAWNACDDVSSWRRVRCVPYGLVGGWTCYECNDGYAETFKTYVYAYNDDCTRGAEQVTCNFDPLNAAQNLGKLRLGGDNRHR